MAVARRRGLEAEILVSLAVVYHCWVSSEQTFAYGAKKLIARKNWQMIMDVLVFIAY